MAGWAALPSPGLSDAPWHALGWWQWAGGSEGRAPLAAAWEASS